MVLAYHVIFGAYGFWLPNDPRGSWSTFVGRWELVRFGKATTVTTTSSLARKQHDREARLAAKQSLLFPPVRFTGVQALAVAKGFATAMAESGYVVHACAILPGHVHLVIARHSRNVEQNVGHMKARATQDAVRVSVGATILIAVSPPGLARRVSRVARRCLRAESARDTRVASDPAKRTRYTDCMLRRAAWYNGRVALRVLTSITFRSEHHAV
jgi:hypothetical protein